MLLIIPKKKEKAEITLSVSNEYENTLVAFAFFAHF